MDKHQQLLREASEALASFTPEDLQALIDAGNTSKLIRELHLWEAFAIAGLALAMLELFVILYLGGAPMW